MKIASRKSRPLLTAMLAALSIALSGVSLAQDLTADEVLAQMTEAAETAQDASFLLTGRLLDPDGSSINLEVEIEVVPGERAGRAYFIQPDALADNVIVFDGDAVYNYIFLTNQVTVFDANDPDALGGFLGGQEIGGQEMGEQETTGQGPSEGFTLSLDLDALFAGWEASLVGYEPGAYELRLDNSEEGATIDHVLATVEEGTWVPTQLVLTGGDGQTLAELFVENFRRDGGLSAEDVTYIPEDAEVIDERN
ncbi:MAG: outer membrane lipoprotein carrier protein LolA [Trueperaceae bacterium]